MDKTNLVEEVAIVLSRQTLQESSEGRRKPIVRFVATTAESERLRRYIMDKLTSPTVIHVITLHYS
jgi:hypothetical protein